MTRAVLHFIWLLFAVVMGQIHVSITGTASEGTLAIVSCLIGLQTIYGFIVQGGNRLNASSAALYAILLFSIFPALYTALGLQRYEHKTNIESLIIATILAGVLQWAILSICPPRKIRDSHVVSAPLSNTSGTSALVMFAVTLALNIDFLAPLQSAAGLLTILFAAVALVTAPTVARLILPSILLLSSVAYYSVSLFSGFGRLNLGVIGFGVLLIMTLRFSGYLVKICILIATAPAVVFLAYQRVSFLEGARGTDIEFDEGISSVVGPFTSAGVLINRMLENVIDPSLGTTIFAALVVWIPSAVWPGKPPGFGSEMVSITKPQLANVSIYSDAALITGEAVWNFGIWGSILMFFLFALLVKYLDKGMIVAGNRLATQDAGLPEVIRLVFITLLSCGILNLFWGGWHTYAARLFVEIALLLCVLFISALVAKTKRKPRLSSVHGLNPYQEPIRTGRIHREHIEQNDRL